MQQRITLIFAILAALLLPNINAITQEDKLEVIASYSILADVVYNIAGDHIELTTLIPTGADPHGFQPSPRDLTPLSEADVIFVNGAGFEETLLGVIEGAAEDAPIVEISACVGIIPIGASGHMHDDHDEHGHDDEHADDHDDEHGHGDDDDHAHEDEDEHAHDDDDHADDHDDEHGHDDDDHADEHDDEHGHDDDDHADEDEDEHAHDDDDHADEHDDEHGHDDDDHADDHDDEHGHDDDDHADDHDDEHMHDDMHSHCDEHDAEFASLVAAHHGMESEVVDLGPWSGEWKSNWSFAQAELQAGYDAILAATPELTQDLLSQFIEAANYTPFNQIAFDEGSVAFDGVACDYGLADQSSVPQSLGEVSLFETVDEACGDTRYLLLGLPYGAVEDGTFHFHMRIGASFDEVIDEQSLSFPSIFMDSIDATIINSMYTAFGRAIGLHIATTYGLEIALSDEEMAAMSGDDSGEEDSHGHEEDGHAHGPVLGRLEDIECGGHGHGHDHEAHAHEEGACDPHVWMDPHNIIYWSLMVRDVLSELDPSHAEEYAAAAEDYIGELVALEEEFILPLLEELPVDKRILITSHDSLGYLAASFDFVIIGTVIPGASTQVEPSASDVSALIDLVKETGVAAIFGETIVNTAVLETIAAETGAELAVIYTGTLSVDGPASTYLDYMRYNLRTIVEALGAGG